MSTPINKYEHIVLHDKAADRAQAYKVNRQLLFVYWLILLINLGVFMHFVITDQNYIREYRESTLNYIIGMSVWLLVALFLSYLVMWLPSFFFAKMVSPEIFLTDTHLVYLSGSVVLNYGSLVAVHRPLIFLLGHDISQKIRREDITSITVEKARFLKPGFGRGDYIAVKHKNGKITTGIWLSQNQKQSIVDRLNNWRK